MAFAPVARTSVMEVMRALVLMVPPEPLPEAYWIAIWLPFESSSRVGYRVEASASPDAETQPICQKLPSVKYSRLFPAL